MDHRVVVGEAHTTIGRNRVEGGGCLAESALITLQRARGAHGLGNGYPLTLQCGSKDHHNGTM